MYGFHRLALAVPSVAAADPRSNADSIVAMAEAAAAEKSAVILFPELSVTGSSCGDLFAVSSLLSAAETAVRSILSRTIELPAVLVIGAPVSCGGRLYDAVLVMQHGRLLGVIPRESFAGRRNLDHSRLFVSGAGITGKTISYAGASGVPFGTDLIFTGSDGMSFAVEIGDDAALPLSPGMRAADAGAVLLLNPFSGSEVIGSSRRRRMHYCDRSATLSAVWAGAGAGVSESTTSGTSAGETLAAGCGKLLFAGERFGRNARTDYVDIDLAAVRGIRRLDSALFALPPEVSLPHREIALDPLPDLREFKSPVDRTPFIPADPEELSSRCQEAVAIQANGLARRLEHTRSERALLGISGGLDSTLALLVAVEAMKLLGRSAADVLAVTMPGFGTSGRTYNNAVELCRLLGVELREISVKAACMQHFSDIGHDPECRNVVYENTQARERTQILLDLANKLNGIVIGTGDLSENALGWCTFNGDHISMYSVNSSVPKSLMRCIIAEEGKKYSAAVQQILQDIIDTPVSPELLPAGADGTIGQKTEEIIGPYEVHDFFLYHLLKYGAEPRKILYLAALAFAGEHSREELAGYLKIFLRRFITQQFKRNCSADGPRIGSLSLSPHGSLVMPSDLSLALWQEDLLS